MALHEVEPEVVAALRRKLVGQNTTLEQKYRVLFSLRNIKGPESQAVMLEGLKDPSALFRHEVAYCLGQRQDPAAVDTLHAVLCDGGEHPMVRHEAGEALGAIGTRSCLAILHDHVDDSCLEVAQTCQLAVQRIQYFQDQQQGRTCPPTADGAHPDEAEEETAERRRYLSVDPTPPAPADTPTPELAATLSDETARIFDRYRAMFALRDRGGPEAVEALGAAFASRSALLKHEVAYVLGQMQDPRGAACLAAVLADASEAAMVRHEAAEALGAIADDSSMDLLRHHAADPEPIVADSCLVALDMLEFEQSGGFQYADDGKEDGTPAAAALAVGA